jgi:nucleoside-diphosphate-sugar epimerase
MSFVMDNVVGTTNLLLYAKENPVEKFIYLP